MISALRVRTSSSLRSEATAFGVGVLAARLADRFEEGDPDAAVIERPDEPEGDRSEADADTGRSEIKGMHDRLQKLLRFLSDPEFLVGWNDEGHQRGGFRGNPAQRPRAALASR